MHKKSAVERFTFWARNLRSRDMFKAVETYCAGDVLDVGGRDFYLCVKESRINFKTWTTLEYHQENVLNIDDERFKTVVGDGCDMTFADRRFDTVLNIQVLEHVFEPNQMVLEIARVLKPKGHAIFLIPQTAVLHELPQHYYNFTRFWITEAMQRAGLEILEIKPLGGVWSSMASHLVYFFFQSFRIKGLSTAECRRNIWFYLLFPLMALYALMSLPICLFLSWGDLTEEPNNHLVIVRKE